VAARRGPRIVGKPLQNIDIRRCSISVNCGCIEINGKQLGIVGILRRAGAVGDPENQWKSIGITWYSAVGGCQ